MPLAWGTEKDRMFEEPERIVKDMLGMRRFVVKALPLTLWQVTQWQIAWVVLVLRVKEMVEGGLPALRVRR